MIKNELQGFTSSSGSFKYETGYNLAIEDCLNEFNSDKWDCDWDNSFGSTARQRLFTIKTDSVRQELMTEIKDILEKHFFAYVDASYTEYDNGWNFEFIVRYMNKIPLAWKVQSSKTDYKLISNGVYQL